MNRKREAYDRLAVGDRIRKKRVQLGFSQDEVAERIDRAPKYCSDIERGTCGMSTETMLAISECLDMSLDYMMFGEQTDEEARRQENDELAVIHILSGCSKQQRDYADPAFEIIYCIYADFVESVIMNHAPGNSGQILWIIATCKSSSVVSQLSKFFRIRGTQNGS